MVEEPPAFTTYRLTLVYWDKTLHYTMIWSHNEAIDGKATILEALPLFEVPLLCCLVSHVWLFLTPWTVAGQAPLSVGFPRQEYWSGWPFPSPGDLPDPGTEPALAGGFFTTQPAGKPWRYFYSDRTPPSPTSFWLLIQESNRKNKSDLFVFFPGCCVN